MMPVVVQLPFPSAFITPFVVDVPEAFANLPEPPVMVSSAVKSALPNVSVGTAFALPSMKIESPALVTIVNLAIATIVVISIFSSMWKLKSPSLSSVPVPAMIMCALSGLPAVSESVTSKDLVSPWNSALKAAFCTPDWQEKNARQRAAKSNAKGIVFFMIVRFVDNFAVKIRKLMLPCHGAITLGK